LVALSKTLPVVSTPATNVRKTNLDTWRLSLS